MDVSRGDDEVAPRLWPGDEAKGGVQPWHHKQTSMGNTMSKSEYYHSHGKSSCLNVPNITIMRLPKRQILLHLSPAHLRPFAMQQMPLISHIKTWWFISVDAIKLHTRKKLTQSPSFLLCGTPISSKVFGPLPGIPDGFGAGVLGGGVADGRPLPGNFGGSKGPALRRVDGAPGVCIVVLGRGPGVPDDGPTDMPVGPGLPFGGRPSLAKLCE